jgi:hypothetical protein
MQRCGAKGIIAIDVGSGDDTHLTVYYEHMFSWWGLLKRLFPHASANEVRDLTYIYKQLLRLSSVGRFDVSRRENIF